MKRLFLPILIAVFALVTGLPEASAVVLRVHGTTAEPAAQTEVRISLDSEGAPLGALVFSVGFDAQKLRFDGTAKTGHQLDNVSVQAPSGYVASSTVLPREGGDAIAISLVRSGVATPLREGEVRLRFETWPDASGSAWVGVLPGASAASTLGALAPIQWIDGSVTIDQPSGELVLAPHSLTFATGGDSREVLLMNRGRAPIVITNVRADGAAFSARAPALPFIIAPGTSTAVVVISTGESREVGSLFVSASSPASETASIPLEIDPSETNHTDSVHRWILPAPESLPGAAVVLFDPSRDSEVSVGSSDFTYVDRIQLDSGVTHRWRPSPPTDWHVLASRSASLRGMLVDREGRHVIDALAVDALPTSIAVISTLESHDTMIELANPGPRPIELEIIVSLESGEEIHRETLRVAPSALQSMQVPRVDDDAPVTVTVRQKSDNASFAAWAIVRSGGVVTLRLAR